MVHYGWACGASWQMLRHASVWEPAVRGRGRRDAAATQHRLKQAIRQASSLQTGKKKEKEKNRALAAIWHPQSFLESCPSTNTHVCEVNGSDFVRCFCANRLHQPWANIALSNAPNVQQSDRGQVTGLFLHITQKKSGVSLENRWPIISCSASCKPEPEHPSLRCHSHHHGTTYSSSTAPPLCASFRLDPFETLSLRSPHLIHTDDLIVSYRYLCAISLRIFSNQGAWSIIQEPGERHRPKIKQSAFETTTIHRSTPPIKKTFHLVQIPVFTLTSLLSKRSDLQVWHVLKRMKCEHRLYGPCSPPEKRCCSNRTMRVL